MEEVPPHMARRAAAADPGEAPGASPDDRRDQDEADQRPVEHEVEGVEHGEDMPEIRDWAWRDRADGVKSL